MFKRHRKLNKQDNKSAKSKQIINGTRSWYIGLCRLSCGPNACTTKVPSNKF